MGDRLAFPQSAEEQGRALSFLTHDAQKADGIRHHPIECIDGAQGADKQVLKTQMLLLAAQEVKVRRPDHVIFAFDLRFVASIMGVSESP